MCRFWFRLLGTMKDHSVFDAIYFIIKHHQIPTIT
jgi:hypothetical protein